MNKAEAYKGLEEHLSTAPEALRDYALKSWDEQAKKLKDRPENLGWIDADFLIYSYSSEGEHFWRSLYGKKWKEALALIPTTQPTYDHINPEHYKQSGKEVIDMMIDIWGKEAVATHCEITAFKYRMRLGLKPEQPIERDIEKAKWYEEKAKELKGGSRFKGKRHY